MEMLRSSTFSSKDFIWNLFITLIVLVGIEVYLSYSMHPFEMQASVEPTGVAESSTIPGFFYVGDEEPVEFLSQLRSTLTDRPVVFIGDSQGIRVRGGGIPYPEQVAALIGSIESHTPVVSMHMQGSNAYEQSILLLCMLELGIEPLCVVWSNSVYSLRENEIRSELVNSYRYVESEISGMSMTVVLPVTQSDTSTPESTSSFFVDCTETARGIALELASVRFMQRSMLEKAEIIRRSPIGRLLGVRSFGTAHQSNPSASILVDAALQVSKLSSLLESRGIHTIVFLSPYNQCASELVFSQEAEEIVFSALESGVNAAGALFLDLSSELSQQHYGNYMDGTEDPLHFDQTGHFIIAELISEIVTECSNE